MTKVDWIAHFFQIKIDLETLELFDVKMSK